MPKGSQNLKIHFEYKICENTFGSMNSKSIFTKKGLASNGSQTSEVVLQAKIHMWFLVTLYSSEFNYREHMIKQGI